MRMKSFAVLVLIALLIAFGVMVFTFAKNVLPKESRLVEISEAS
jgi:hypothetical protein